MQRTLLLAILGLVSVAVRVQAADTLFVDNVAACEGRTPCYATISAAVTAASPGDNIRVFASVYNETVTFAPTKNNITLEWKIAGQPPVIVAPAGGNSALVIDASDVVIRGFVLEADGDVVFISRPGVKRNVILEDNLIKGLPPPPGRAARGVLADNVVDFVLRRSVIRDVAGTGVVLRLAFDAVVQDNAVLNCSGNGILLSLETNANTIRGNVVRGCENGIVSDGESRRHLIEANVVTGNRRDGIMALVTSTSGPQTVRGNTAVKNGVCDLNISGSISGLSGLWPDNRALVRCGAALP